MAKTQKFEGVMSVVCTPFKENLEVDYDAIRRVVDFVIACGGHGFLTTVMSSEFYTLTDEEHFKIVETVIDQVNGRVPVVVGAASRSIEHGLLYARHAQHAGADAICTTPPVVDTLLHGVPFERARDYFRAINEALDIPIFVQNAPPIGGTLTAEQLMQLCTENSHVLYVKEEGANCQQMIPKILEMSKHMPEGSSFGGVLSGGGGCTFLSDLKRGACGTMPASATTDVFVSIWNAFKAGDMEKAQEIQSASMNFGLYEHIYWSAFNKYVLKRRGILDCIRIRETAPSLDTMNYAEIDAIYDTIKPYFCI